MIDYDLLGKSSVYYSSLGYKRVEAPWLVSEKINDITCPPDGVKYFVTRGKKKKVFVASGEQSFLYQINKDFLPAGKYQTITPCLRDESFDQWHTKYFMKNELISFGPFISPKDIEQIINDAETFFKNNINEGEKIDVVRMDEHQYDIMYKGIEIGSYGYRECEFTKWVYGTGLAEPRFTKVKKYMNFKE